MYRKGIAIILSLVIGFLGAVIVEANKKETGEVQSEIADKVVRFRILANSDRKEDQELKLKVRDEVVKCLEPILSSAENVEETKEKIKSNLEFIETTAERVVKDEGYQYEVQAEMKQCYFPMKTYGDCTFPEGDYDALRIRLGNADGKNWWCVLYPNLCFLDSSYGVVTDTQKKQLKNILTEEEYDSILNEKKPKIRFRFKLADAVKNILN